MNIALIIAGGIGNRMGHDIPKQFITVYDKPVIIYTLEAFQNHPDIDKIVAVCIDGWQDTLRDYCENFRITKLDSIADGGNTAQESIRNGINEIAGKYSDNDIVIIHDAVRPLVDISILSDVIATAAKYGNGVSSMPYNEQIFIKTNEKTTCKYIPRETLQRVVTPQGYKLGKLKWAYEKAFRENIGITPSSYTNTMMADLGETLYFASGSDKNIKLTTQDNLEIFKAYLNMK